MPSRRRPPAALDPERFMQRVEERIDQAFTRVLTELGQMQKDIGATQFDVRLGNQAREVMAQRLSDLEMQVRETREHLQIAERTGAEAAHAAASHAVDTATALASSAADVARTEARAAPRRVWKTKLGLITASSAAFVAVVAFFNNLPKFVRGASEMTVSLYDYIIRHR